MHLFASPTGGRRGRNAALRSRTPVTRCLAAAGVALAALVAAPAAHAADLQATPSNFATVFSGAQAGDTIHLATGSYGTFRGGLKPAPGVTLQPADAANVTMALDFDPASNITLRGIQNITDADIDGAQTNHISIVASYFSGQTILRTSHLANAAILLDHDVFGPFDKCSTCYEGRVQLAGRTSAPSGITIQNSKFGPGGNADGIQNGSNGTVIQNNEFTGLKQISGDSVHVDPIQLYGSQNTVIRNNWIHGNAVASSIMAPDDLDHEQFLNNVMDQPVGSDTRTLNMGGDNGSVVRHNTLVGSIMLKADKTSVASRLGVLRDNVVTQGISIIDGSTIADRAYNLGAAMSGLNELAGQPTFLAGTAHPSTVAGYALALTSLGKASASDGADRGADVSNVGPQGPPPGPGQATTTTPTPSPTPSPTPNPTPTPTPTTTLPAPTAAFTWSPTAPRVLQVVHFDGRGSSCAAAPCTYSWADDGPDGPGGTQWPLGSGQTLDFTFSGAGIKRVRLTVKDAQARKATIEHDVVVSR